MSTCETCKYWDDGQHLIYREAKAGSCLHVKLDAFINEPETWEDDRLTAWNAYSSGIITGPRFGCNHWKEAQSLDKPEADVIRCTVGMRVVGSVEALLLPPGDRRVIRTVDVANDIVTLELA